ncbi:MAG: gamma-glutamyl-gamma-aminobutyrate hydrolase family protein [Chloroflexi bacterium]|nr:gamma-glutamyl-gamma-aminobutyrate hydrolase family protein [Chloroflexota bacterium]MBV9600762.1 gamma-glutamyl-gamma-aminobutyrate hydrolase family protein [Chloroflexota bacterium]
MTTPRPLIGITIGPTTKPSADGLSYLRLRSTYVRAVELAGGAPILVPPLGPEALLAVLERLDGIVFPGGPDVDPRAYGEAAHPATDVNAGLDAVELPAAHWAVHSDIPVLGICRGQQLVNVALGGTLRQHIEHHTQQASRHELSHQLRVQSGSRLADVLGATTLEVNSFHHQSVDRLGVGLQAVAWSPDGVVEGLESADRWLVCVQFHPEDLVESHAPSQRLLEAFVAACRAHSGAGGGDAACQLRKPGQDLAAKRRDPQQHDQRDGGNDDPILDDVLRP